MTYRIKSSIKLPFTYRNGKTDEGRDVEVGASADCAGIGRGPASANHDPQGTSFRSPIGDQLKFQARSPRPLETRKKSTPEDEVIGLC